MIRVATAVLSGRIFAGHPLKSGLGFREPRHDVTNDVYQAIKDHIGIGHQITLQRDGEPGFIIRILPLSLSAADTSDGKEIPWEDQKADLLERLRKAESAISTAYYDGFVECSKHKPWPDMFDWAAVAGVEYARLALSDLAPSDLEGGKQGHMASVAESGSTAQEPKSDSAEGH